LPASGISGRTNSPYAPCIDQITIDEFLDGVDTFLSGTDIPQNQDELHNTITRLELSLSRLRRLPKHLRPVFTDITTAAVEHAYACLDYAYLKRGIDIEPFIRELHPEKKPGPDWRYQKVDWLEAKKQRTKALPVATCFIPPDIVLKSVRPDRDSDFVTFLRAQLDPIVVEGLINDYQLGVTSKKDVIFFQLDINGSCRTGKIMKYDPETGHRIKDEKCPSRITWVHSLMKYPNGLPEDWQLTQCLFGEHLLKQYPGKVVALVESEKTAVICAGLMPRFLWLATGGKSQINDRLLVLKGRKIVAFPDIDGYDEWQRKLAEYPELAVTISPVLQQNATKEDREAHIDIADWLIRYLFDAAPEDAWKRNTEFLKAVEFLSPENQEQVGRLIEELDLVFLGAEKVEEGCNPVPAEESPP